MTAQLPATKGYIALVDGEDHAILSRFSWYAHNGNGQRPRPAHRTSARHGRKVIFLTHCIVRAPAGFVVDHINGDPWDNRRENLRICTNAENVRNRRNQRKRPGLFKGVTKIGRTYLAQIGFDGRLFRLGGYGSAREAALAYDAAALALHGEFASPNFPNEPTAPALPEELRTIAAARKKQVPAEVAAVLAEARLGTPLSRAAAIAGVSYSTAHRWARREGVPLTRGRPRTPARSAA